MPTSQSLVELQRWMQTVITHPGGIGAGIASDEASQIIEVGQQDLERVILPSRELGSVDRLQVYGSAYFGRLIECLRAQFPAVCQAVGEDAFDRFGFGYLVQYPSTSYTLVSLGDSFDAHLSATRPARSNNLDSNQPDFADFVIELARLERTYSEVFDGPGPERSATLKSQDLEGLTPEAFAGSRLQFHSCVRLLELQFPVHEYASAVRHGRQSVYPEARPVNLVVTRRDYVVRRFEVTRQQFDLLSALKEQRTVGQALELIWTDSDVEIAGLVRDIQTWFREWSAAPLFASIER